MGQNFRAGVVVVVLHPSDRRVLAFERVDAPGHWQLPQGGLESGESASDAAWRELREETGLGPDHVTLTDVDPTWIVYEWPPEIRASGRGRRHPDRLGQAQRWFWFTARSADVTPVPDGREFGAWCWMDHDRLLDTVVRWRREAYRCGFERGFPRRSIGETVS